MRNLKILALLSLFVLFCSCFEHEDEVTISKTGKIDIVSIIKVNSNESKAEVQEALSHEFTQLKKAGWNVSYRWMTATKPYKIQFVGSNTLNNIYNYIEKTKGENPSGIYVSKKYSDTEFAVTFDLLTDADNRIVRLGKKSLPLYSFADKDKLQSVRNIESKKNYIVILQ
ncbi:hypothetical protein [Frigoriflavimonas asaccharolytica]|uniref:Lipoprotein n=1 Tax=Frigoriflavimonas asaccharolytica TaxID=2735899 RepID=A0A8J8K9P1_9FLAO|nr:hypothetical protein [Frigoriflavimonas asaccharolytica]NRS93993.1 hypothetical protein [Frigoriflavimonas asaccharolytica]